MMQCLCEGPYPSIEQQARTLHDEHGMPEWGMPRYRLLVQQVNEMLLGVVIAAMQKRGNLSW